MSDTQSSLGSASAKRPTKQEMILRIIAIVLIVGIIFMAYLMYITTQPTAKDFERVKSWNYEFDTTEMKDRLFYVDENAHNGDRFSLESKSEAPYIITLAPTDANPDKIFRWFAKAGDTIIKARNSKTLILKKDGKEYFFYRPLSRWEENQHK